MAAAERHLRDGRPVAVPTDTVYGLAGPEQRLYELKGRPADMPIAVLAADISAAAERGRLGAQDRILAGRFWPGQLTLVVPDRRHPGATVGLRVPDHDLLRVLIRRVGGSLPTTSANVHGRPTPPDAGGVAEAFGDAADLLVVDGGPCRGRASTVARLSADGALVVLREGTIREDQMMAVLASQFG